eukprot:CAMPEP_0201919124 /NCGR_PEP_ID=MMETSP0903-20130614/8109_1 /ASSEMBLY_ACC=CAM_ASM_000552 /TAXON_ID=420261 /ORGANISM="Thalassiosira antarctica, Strain CCMP982" /LENGTH=900 /DNA_ID=CAMNT_0048455587 /DNA_START=108 /DNA_END=2810 /DNA_ORIENTATION=+
MMGFSNRMSIDNAKEGADDDDDDASAEAEHLGSSGETMLSQSQGSIVEATEVQYPPPPPMMAASRKPSGIVRKESVDRGVRKTRSLPDLPPSPVHSSLAVARSRTEYDKAYDEETVGMMTSPLSEREETHEPEASNGPGGSVEASKPSYCERNENVAQEKADKPRGNMSRESSLFAERNISLLETEPVTNLNEKAGGETMDATLGHPHNSPSAINHAERGHGKEGEVPDGAQKDDEDMELMLTTTDIGDCIKAIAVAKQIIEADQSQDPFHGIDIEQWQSIFEDFKKYIAALGDPSSTEAEELQQINNHDKVYAIFDRGMDVNDCNALFIYNMIRTISGGIDVHGKSHSHRDRNRPSHDEAHDGFKKLNHLAACLDMIFGVNEDSDPLNTAVSVSVSKAERENSTDSTVLKFSKTLEASNQNDELASSTIQQPMSHTMPPTYIQAMSQIFARFAAENTGPLQSQLDSSRKTLAATREGAMNLQRQALKVQDDLQAAQTEAEEANSRQEVAEAELGRQKYEFERREESFERVKEHYKAEIDRKELELANVKERYGRELKEAKAELARVKHRYTEQRSTEQRSTEQRKRKESDDGRNEHQMKHQRSEHHRRHGMHPDPNANIHQETTSDDQISPSIPKKIEYHPTDPFGGDAEGSRKRSKVSGRQSRHSTGNVTSRKSYPPAPFELQPPRRSRASSEQKVRATDHKTDQHHGSFSRTGEQAREHSGRFGKLGGANQRNALKSLTENNSVDNASGVNFREKKESRNRPERSSRKDQQPHDERIEREEEEGNQTSNFASTSRKHNVTKNPYLKQSKPAKKVTNETSNGEPSFAYQEVVRGRDKRAALPGHDCEECRKFFDALGKGYDTGQMVMECSRHRARHVPPSTPPNFWNLTFIDSVGSKD